MKIFAKAQISLISVVIWIQMNKYLKVISLLGTLWIIGYNFLSCIAITRRFDHIHSETTTVEVMHSIAKKSSYGIYQIAISNSIYALIILFIILITKSNKKSKNI